MNNTSKKINFSWAILYSLLIVNATWIFVKTILASRHFEGFMMGLVETLWISFLWCIVSTPWLIVVFLFYYFTKWKRFRTSWVILPAIAFSGSVLYRLITYPTDAASRFQARFHQSIPALASEIRNDYFSSIIDGEKDVFYFSCQPEDVEALLSTMKMEDPPEISSFNGLNPIIVFPGWPDYHHWSGLQRYWVSIDKRFYQLLTDGSRRRVYISVSYSGE